MAQNKKRRLGQGHGSGRVKTSGRGTKGQKARGKIKLSFEGGALPLIKRIPFARGKNKNKGRMIKPAPVTIGRLTSLPKNSEVTVALLVKEGIVSAKDAKDGIKIIGNGEMSVALTVKVPTSQGAAKAIEKAGGTVVA